ncbi:MAG: hypothetical protein NTX50_01895 [Candidatus Sumerlaeota bacterium]|nr:hypothetical protein [Candidatus Sumerlaeota bacterium]
MSHTLTISDALYEQLQDVTRIYGLKDIEQLLETWEQREEELSRRREAVRRIDAVRERVTTTYGEQPDSVEMIREDRER